MTQQQHLRLRVVSDDEKKLVVPVEVGKTTTVQELQFQLEERLDRTLGRLEIDGYVLESSDLAVHVLRDDDTVMAISMQSWIKSLLPKFEETILQVQKEDLDTGTHRFVALGRPKSKDELWIALGQGLGPRASKAHVDVLRCLKGPEFKDGILAASNGLKWHLAAKVHDRVLTLENKPSHASRPTTASLKVDSDTLTCKLLGVDDPENPVFVHHQKFFKEERTGPTLTTEMQHEDSKLPGEFEHVATSGDDPNVVVALSHVVGTELYQKIDNTVLRQYIAVNLIIFNKSERPYEVQDVTIRGDGVKTYLGKRTGCCYYNYENDRSLKVKAKTRAEVAVIAEIPIPLNDSTHVWDAKRSLHRTIPSPTTLEVDLTTFDNHVKTMTVAVTAPPLELPSRKDVEKHVGTNILAYMTCDDTDAVERMSWAAGVATDASGDFLKITRPPGGSGGYLVLRPSDLVKLAYTASSSAEIPIDSLAYKATRSQVGTCSITVVGLLDDDSDTSLRRVSALRVHLRTNTGSTTASFPLPHLRTALQAKVLPSSTTA